MRNWFRNCVILLVGALFFIRISTCPAQLMDTVKAVSVFSGSTLPFTVLSSAYPYDSADSSISVILFLHGAGERGKDNAAHLAVGLPHLVTTLNALHTGPYIIVAPQCPVDTKWVNTDWTAPSHTMGDITPVLAHALQVFDSIVDGNSRIDTNRLYITGLSMGGFGVWDVIQRYPTRFAAAVPICGGGDLAQAAVIKKVPIWAFHGKKDKLVKVTRTTDMVNAVHHAGGNVRESIYEDIGHLCWNKAYQDVGAMKWFISQRRN
jgi:predicted peptidase